MTDSTDDDEQNRAIATGSERGGDRVPADTEWELTVQVPFDRGELHDLTSAIIVGVAEAEGISPRRVKEPPLYEIVDVAALEEAFFGSPTLAPSNDTFRSVEFMYRGHRIVVRSDAWIQVYRRERSES